jgi:CheY-like chemotaxis protein
MVAVMTLSRPTALVADDNYFNRDLCRLAMENAGYDVFDAIDGRSTLERLQEQPFDLLVLDLAMPEITGIEVIHKMTRQTSQQPTTMVVMTANPHMATEEVQEFADFIFYKPIDVLAFANLARRLLVHMASH